MKVLFIASEMAPFAKTGGLGDVVGSLPKALKQAGVDVRVVMPHYSMITEVDYRHTYTVERQTSSGDVVVHSTEVDGVPVYFLKSFPYFVDDGKIYTVWDWDTPRFIYFAQMAMEFVWQLAVGAMGEAPWWADVLHVHDWHTGLVPFLLHEARFNEGWNDMASVMTIHNMGFQGPYAGGWLWEEGFNNRDHPDLIYQDWRDNLLAIGIAYAQKVNTVSPHHATELHYPRFGEGLQDLIWRKGDDFSGIINGIDTDRWNPATDPHLAHNYDADNFVTERVANKTALQAELGLEVGEHIPLIGVVSRLTEQKGFDFAIPGIKKALAGSSAQFVGLGTGDPYLNTEFAKIGTDFGWKARAIVEMNIGMARKINAAADIVLVPSRYEPCGLTQINAMRYGALPVVRETGGLKDTVQNYDNAKADTGTGFSFLFEESNALADTIQWALQTYHERPAAWQRMQKRGMTTDWSWNNGTQRYIDLYEAALAKKRAWRG